MRRPVSFFSVPRARGYLEAYSIPSETGLLISSGFVNHQQTAKDEAGIYPGSLQLRVLRSGLLQDGLRETGLFPWRRARCDRLRLALRHPLVDAIAQHVERQRSAGQHFVVETTDIEVVS